MTSKNPKRLIEVNFPLREVSAHSIRESRVREGHLRTLHIWWARRPLAASRAAGLAALLPNNPEKAEEYLQLIRELAPWEAVSKNTIQNEELLERARTLIREAHGGNSPKVLDCFAGGGAIPLEALRLGCETYALDYNPVAVLLNKAVLEYPQKFGKFHNVSDTASGTLRMEGQRTVNPLLEEVKRWGKWVLDEARKELDKYHPKDKDGSVPVGYIWARTLPCQNAECKTEIPLMRQTWLANKDKKKIALRMIPDKRRKQVEFEIVEGEKIDFDPEEGTVSRAHVRCPVCGNTGDDHETRQLFREGRSGQRMVAIVLHHPDRTGKTYRLPTDLDLEAYRATENPLEEKRQALWAQWGIDPVPDEPLKRVPISFGIINVWVYGIDSWGKLFQSRQKLALITLCDLVRQAYAKMLAANCEPEFAKAVTVYLSLVMDKLADFSTVLCRWGNDDEGVTATFGRQALPMVWDYAESNPVGSITGSWAWGLNLVCRALEKLCLVNGSLVSVLRGSATELPWTDGFFDAVLTDPPYYDNVPYSYISDFFYVWLKRAVGDLYPELFATPLTPKSDEIVAYTNGGSPDEAKHRFETMLTHAFREVHRVLKQDGISVIVFAYPKAQAWESVISGLLSAGMYMTGSWPIHTEMQGRLRAQGAAALASSIYMVCRKRTSRELGEYPKVRLEIEQRVRQQLDKFWDDGIRGADFFMSAIGPAVEVFGRYERVEKLSGETVGVTELIDYVEKVVSEFALERILGSTELGGVDAETRFYLLWRWTYGHASVPFDEANKLALAVGMELKTLWGKGGLVSKDKDFVSVLGPKEREKETKFMTQAIFTTMVDVLQRACLHWERSERQPLKELLSETYGANNIFWRVAQNIADVLPKGDKEKQLLQGLLNVAEAREKATQVTGKLFAE